jgi:hypothetical protein
MRAIALLAIALVACGDTSGPHGFSTGPAVTTAPHTTAGTSTGELEASSTTSTGSALPESTGAPPPDMGPQPDFGSEQPIGCKGKIDFVFVISRYAHMKLYQQRLLASFDGFMATIAAEFAEFDTHILVANPDDGWPGDECVTWECTNIGCEDFPCEAYANGDLPMDVFCERTIGAGVLFPARGEATNHECELAGGNRYITSEEPDVAAAFKCLATLGTFGGSPSSAEALVEAVSAELNAPDGCNAGFLRANALLVVTIIADTADTWSASKDWPYEWYDDVVAAKGGDPDSVVILSIVAPKPEDPPKPDCLYDYDPPSNRLYEFTEMFPHHVISSVCEDSYVPAFAEAAQAVKTACTGFIPQ